MCRLDKHKKRTIQSSGNKGLCCTGPYRGHLVCSTCFTDCCSEMKHLSAGLGRLSSPTSAVNLRQAIILLLTATCQSISTSEIHRYILSFVSLCLSGLVKGSASVTRYRRQSFCLSLFLHKRMHNSLKHHRHINKPDTPLEIKSAHTHKHTHIKLWRPSAQVRR